MEKYYYHAETELPADADAARRVYWSETTRRGRAAAESEARAMARRIGGRGCVEYWDRKRGLMPGGADCVEDAYYCV